MPYYSVLGKHRKKIISVPRSQNVYGLERTQQKPQSFFYFTICFPINLLKWRLKEPREPTLINCKGDCVCLCVSDQLLCGRAFIYIGTCVSNVRIQLSAPHLFSGSCQSIISSHPPLFIHANCLLFCLICCVILAVPYSSGSESFFKSYLNTSQT